MRLRGDFTVELVESAGSDELICKAARVSTLGALSIDSAESGGLINFLMRGRHGSPFEHGLMMFRIEAPIFVWREFMRHRIGFSYNEESARYKDLDPVFYFPVETRALRQVGKAGQYRFEQGTPKQRLRVELAVKFAYRAAWWAYKAMLKVGVAREVARIVLPVGIYSSAYVTCNPRSLMSFLSLRTKDETSMFPSFPQWEIEQVARQMEGYFETAYPLTAEAFQANGRVSP